MSEAHKRNNEDDTAGLLAQFATRIIQGEPTADLFGVDEDFAHTVVHQAYQHYSNRSYAKAETLLRGAIVLDNQHTYAFLLLGDVLLQRSAYKEAVSMLERALELDGNEPHIRMKLGEAYLRCGRPVEAVSMLEESVKELEDDSLFCKRAVALLKVARRQDKEPAEQA